MFCGEQERDNAQRRYKSKVEQLKKLLGRTDELKAHTLPPKYRDKLFSVLKDCYSFSTTVNVHQLYEYVVKGEDDITRYKDHILCKVIREQIRVLISNKIIRPTISTAVKVNIDMQPTASNGFYNCHDAIERELFEKTKRYDAILQAIGCVEVNYRDSARDYLIQSSDILANRIWNAHTRRKPILLNIAKHCSLREP